jgi:hypothetical protein
MIQHALMIAAKENYGMGFAATYLLLGMVDPFLFCFSPPNLDVVCICCYVFSFPFCSIRIYPVDCEFFEDSF